MLSTRLTAIRRAPLFVRQMSDAGSVAKSKEFSQREKGQEDAYARKHETELLQRLKKEIEAKKTELAQLEKEHAEVAKK
ncbi:hypothetical protein PLICRDRAFT_180285 [Plicaturopsis crispa FD-325 SS-3]|uniref:ATPase inhibitor, mitochondrial n=1 Tax=Plicaturopsis crispa FD-325 SS-3 TaxID=944288 RepID=A0A0C9SWG7_PLICR|nr:hypothetical protein PLICRDRAFT_180285 [Plicaturopsis crispa FD-325 SS-3]